MSDESKTVDANELVQLAMKEVGINPETGGSIELEGGKNEDTGDDSSGDPGTDSVPGDAPVEPKPDKGDDTAAAASEETPKEAPQEEPVHQRLAYLSKQDRILKERENKIAEREKALETEYKAALEFANKFKTDPFAMVEEHLGPDAYKQWTKKILKDGDSIEDKRYSALQREIAELRAEREKPKEEPKAEEPKGMSDDEEKEVKAYFSDIDEAAKKHELVRLVPGAMDECYELARLYTVQTGQVMAAEDVVKNMEDFLEKQYSAIHEVRSKKDKPKEEKKEETKPAENEVVDNSLSSETTAKRPTPKSREDWEREALAVLEESLDVGP